MSNLITANYDTETTGAVPSSIAGTAFTVAEPGLNSTPKLLRAPVTAAATTGSYYSFAQTSRIVARFRVKTPDANTYGNFQIGLHVSAGTQVGSAPVFFEVGAGIFRVINSTAKVTVDNFTVGTEYLVTIIADYATSKFVLYINNTKYDNAGAGYNFYTSATAGSGFQRFVLGAQSATAGVTAGAYGYVDDLTINAIDGYATTYAVSGPSSVAQSTASTPFTASLPTDMDLASDVVITPSDGGAGGTFSPTSITLGKFVYSGQFTYTNSAGGTKSISYTNSGSLTNPSPSTINVVAPGASIAITPIAVPFFQRVGDVKGLGGTADIPLAGTYASGLPTAIEWRFKGGNWSAVSGAAPSGGTWSGTAMGVPAGQGLLEVRYANDTAVTSGTQISVGDKFLCAGQSNMSGRGLTNQTAPHPSLTAYLLGNDNVYKVLADPYDSSVNQVDTVSRDSSAGSYVISLANRIMTYTKVPVMMTPCPLGGTAISKWQPGDASGLYANMIARGQAMGTFRAILWHQGESDKATAQATYKSLLQNLANSALSTFPNTKFIPCKLHNNLVTVGAFAAVNAAIGEAWGTGNIIAGADLTDIDSDDASGDHFQSTARLTAVADRQFVAMLTNLYGVGAAGGGATIIRRIRSVRRGRN